MAIYTVQEQHLAKIEAKSFQSFPTIIFSFQTVGHIQKARSKIMAAVRTTSKMPPYKYVVGINPNRLKYTNTYIESALTIAIINSVHKIIEEEKNYVIAGEIDINGNLIPLTKIEAQQIIFTALQNSQIDKFIIPLNTILPVLPKTSLQIFTASSIAEIIHKKLQPYKKVSNYKQMIINNIEKDKFFRVLKHPVLISASTRFNTIIYQHNYSKYAQLDSFIINKSLSLLPEEILYLSQYRENFPQLGINLLQERPVFILHSNISQKLLHKILSHLAYGVLIINNRTELTNTTYDTIYNFINQINPYLINKLTNKFPTLQIICNQSYCKCGNLYSRNQCVCNGKNLSIKPKLNSHPLLTKFIITIDLLVLNKYQEIGNLLHKQKATVIQKEILRDTIRMKIDYSVKEQIQKLYLKLSELYPLCTKQNLLKITLLLSQNDRQHLPITN